MRFLRDRMSRSSLSFCLVLLFVWRPGSSHKSEPERDVPDPDWDWGSGLHELLNSFPADSPFLRETPGRPANCTQRFWLPSSSPVCWDDIAEPEEFEKSRLLVLQNRAALQAVSSSSGLEEGGASYDQQARDDVKGVRDEHLALTQTADTMQRVFMDLDEKRKEGKEHYAFTSLKEQIDNTRESITRKEKVAAFLEKHLALLEKSMNSMQLRLTELLSQ